MKKTQAKISVYELTKISIQREIIIKSFTTMSLTSTSTPSSKKNSSIQSQASINLQSIVNVSNANSVGLTLPFIFYFEIFNYNVKNFLANLGVSTNVMPLSMLKKLNIQPKKTDAKIIQLDISQFPFIDELNNVIIRMSSDSGVRQCINTVVVEIPKTYGLFLSKYWSRKLQGYFATDWSHLWLPYIGKNNEIGVNSESYMKYTFTDLEALNEPFIFSQE